MHKVLMSGALAAALWAGGALAQNDQVSTPQNSSCVDVNDPNCASGSVSAGTGGAGTEATVQQPAEPQPETQAQPQLAPQQAPNNTVIVEPQPAYLPTQPQPEVKHQGPAMSGVTVEAGAGVEGYTGVLRDRIDLGPAYGVNVNLRPSKVVGLELGYNGAANDVAGQTSSGPDIYRNAGQALLNVGLTATPVQPYLLGGVGVNNYSVRGDATAMGFHNDTAGMIPVGAGLRTHLGNFTADLRFDYQVPFNESFASATSPEYFAGMRTQNSQRYQSTLNIGSTF